MRRLWVLSGFLVLLVADLSGAEGLALRGDGIVFPDGSVQSSAGASEVANFFHLASTVTVSPGFAGVLNTSVGSVPAGYRALIEDVSVRCFSPSDNQVVETSLAVLKSNSFRVFAVPLQWQGVNPFSGVYHVGRLSPRLVSEASPFGGSSINSNVLRTNGNGTTSCHFAVGGRYLPIPAGEAPLAPETPAESPAGMSSIPGVDIGFDGISGADGAIHLPAPPDG